MDTLHQVSELIWSTKFDDADHLLESSLHQLKNKATVSHQASLEVHHQDLLISSAFVEISLWRAFLGDSPQTFDECFRRLSVQEEVVSHITTESNLSPNPLKFLFRHLVTNHQPTPTGLQLIHLHTLIVYGELHAAKSGLLFKRQNYITGGVSARRGWKSFQKARALLKEMNITGNNDDELSLLLISRLHFGIGIYNYAISLVPPTFNWIVILLGFQGDPDLALESLKRTSEMKTSRSSWATVLLIGIQWLLSWNEKKEATKKTEEMIQLYPNSSVLWSLSAGFQRQLGNLELSTTQYQKAYECADQLPQLQLTLNYEIGHNEFLQLKFREAVPKLEEYLQNSTSPYFKAFGTFKLGFCYWMLGQRDEILPLYSKIEGYVRPGIAYDAYALRKGKEFINKGGFTKLEEDLMQAAFLVEGMLFSQTESFFSTIEKQLESLSPHDTIDESAWVFYLKALVLKEKNQPKEALDFFERAYKLGSKAKRESWVATFCCIEMAEILLKKSHGQEPTHQKGFEVHSQGQDLKSTIEHHLHLAKERNGYDFYKQAHIRIAVFERKLRSH